MSILARVFSGFISTLIVYLYFASFVSAVSLAEQTKDYSGQLNTWQLLQELGDTLEGPLQTFTFRVRTTQTNLEMFDSTAKNTAIYDKTDGNKIVARSCILTNGESALGGLSFNTKGVPAGFEDVSIDFSCRNFNFIRGHKYLIYMTNANHPTTVIGRILFAVSTKDDNFTQGGLRYSDSNVTCRAENYKWNSQELNSGCGIFVSTKSDIYFVLSNSLPPPKVPVIFIPGIGGSELKAVQDIVWNNSDGHGGTFSHTYKQNENIWVNSDEAIKLGDDDYFDVLKLKPDGTTSEASLALTGNLVAQGYSDIDTFFTSIGFVKNTNFFVFPYDWRRDISLTKNDLDALIESVKQKSGQAKVNIVAHSMGGLVARNYIADSTKASKVNGLIEVGVPHLGSPESLKTFLYGEWLARDLYLFKLGIVPSEVKDIFLNLISGFELTPNLSYYKFYDNSDSNKPFPFYDERDVDQDKATGALNYDQTKSLLTNLKFNINLFNLAESFHTSLNQSNGVKLYYIVGSGQPTLGQIKETWWVDWPIELIPRYEEIFINGDDTVPLYSASLVNEKLDLSAGAKIYYIEQSHSDLVSKNGTAMQTVRSILNAEDLPSDAKSEKIALDGTQISVDQDMSLDIYDESNQHTGLGSNGEVENNIADTAYSSIGDSKHIFVKKKAKKVTVKLTPKKSAKKSKITSIVKIRSYTADKITKTGIYPNITLTSTSSAQIVLEPGISTTPPISLDSQTIPALESQGTALLDQTPPTTQLVNSSGVITLTSSDTSGVFQTQYSLDNGQNVYAYTQPIAPTTAGDYTLQYFSTDKLGIQELPQTYKFTLTSSPESSNTNSGDTSSTSSTTSSEQSNSTPTPTPSPGAQAILPNNQTKNSEVLGVDTQEPSSETSKQDDKRDVPTETPMSSMKKLIVGLAATSAVAGAGLAFTFFKPTPR